MKPIPRAAMILSTLSLVGAAAASAVTLAWSGAFPDPFPAPAFNGVLVEARGWSAVTLGLALPLLIASLSAAVRGSLRGRLAWLGTLGYLAYTYLEFAVGPPFTALYLVYIATFACAIPALVMGVASIDTEELARTFGDRTPRRSVAGFALASAALLAIAWLNGIGARTIAGDFGWPQGEAAVGHVVHALDLGLVVPLGVATGLLLLRRRPGGYVAAAVMLVTSALMGAALVAMVAAHALVSGRSVLGSAPFVVLPLVAVTLAFAFFGAIRRVGGEHEERPHIRRALRAPARGATMDMPSPSLIARFMPAFSLRQVDRVAVAASPGHAYAAARTLDMSGVGFVRLLFQLRVLPDRIVARYRGQPYPPLRSSGIEDITRAGSGFVLLGEEPGREVVVGAVGKFWQPTIEYASVSPAGFAAFDRPGFGRLAWCIRVDPREGGGSWVGFELRVGATDAPSLARFKRYWWIIGRFSHAIRRSFLGKLLEELGPAGSDERRRLEGDDLLATSRIEKTHGVTIEAPVHQVWPWLVQIGARRAGWYSFDLLDNGGMHSAERIVPELQKLSVGDIIPALPRRPDGFAVLRLEPERALVLGDPSLLPGVARSGGPPWRTTWSFVLEPIGTAATRLTVRARADYAPRWSMAIVRPLMGMAHEIMERRQLHNLRRRAEAVA